MANVRIARGEHSNADHRSDQRKVQVVYFILVDMPKDDGGPRIKIGETCDFRKRLDEHRKPKFGREHKCEPLCVVQGNRADEQQLLRHFDEFRVVGEKETFWPRSALVDYIRWLRDQYFAWVPDDAQGLSIDELEQLETVDGDVWMPRPGRIKEAPRQIGLFSDFGLLNLPPREVTVDDFYTSPLIIEAARQAMGGIDLDPASHAVANKVVKATRFFTAGSNGLLQDWGGRVWLNPPYSQWKAWIPKIVREWESGRCDAMCILSATRTLTAQYFADIHRCSSAVCILHGRIPFWGGRAATPDDGHAVFYFGRDVNRFCGCFDGIGNTYKR